MYACEPSNWFLNWQEYKLTVLTTEAGFWSIGRNSAQSDVGPFSLHAHMWKQVNGFENLSRPMEQSMCANSVTHHPCTLLEMRIYVRFSATFIPN